MKYVLLLKIVYPIVILLCLCVSLYILLFQIWKRTFHYQAVVIFLINMYSFVIFRTFVKIRLVKEEMFSYGRREK